MSLPPSRPPPPATNNHRQATVDAVHARVLEALQALYDRHKASYGWADRPLSIE